MNHLFESVAYLKGLAEGWTLKKNQKKANCCWGF
jgi:hypothetical protein